MIDRRALLWGSVAALGVARPAESQQSGKAYRIGFLRNGPPPTTFIEGLRQGLRDLGSVEGQSVAIEYGLTGSADELPAAAVKLVSLEVYVKRCLRGRCWFPRRRTLPRRSRSCSSLLSIPSRRGSSAVSHDLAGKRPRVLLDPF